MTTPILIVDRVRDFYRDLDAGQKAWWNNAENTVAVGIIKRYLNENSGNVDYSMDFGRDFIQATIETGLNLDFEKSLKSPANIDPSSIDDSTVEGGKFNCIYKTLTTSSSFKQLFTNTFGEDNRLNIKFEIADNLPANVNGICNLSTINVNGRITYNNLIRINNGILNNSKSDIFVARVIIHEFIHAYLNIKASNCNNGSTIPYLSNLQLAELIGTFYQGFNCHISVNGNTQSQHDFIFNHMTPSFVSILSEIKDQLISQAHQNQASQESFYNSVTGFSEDFSWNELFYNMALSGLHETESFQTTIQSDPQKNNKFIFYNSLSHQLTKNCH